MKSSMGWKPEGQVLGRKSAHLDQQTKLVETVNLNILIGEYEMQLSLPKKTKVAELNTIVKAFDQLHEIHGPVGCQACCLASCEGYEVLDYWLMQPDKTLEPIRNNQRLKVLYVESQPDQRPICLSDFEPLKCLGKGGSCAVYLVRNRRSCQLLALKQIAKDYISEYKRFEQILRERKILMQLPSNKFTINCHAAFESDKHLNFLMDYCPGGQLFYHIKEGLLANDASVKVYFCQILTCIEFLHQNKILYRDLKVSTFLMKPENILVDIDGHLRIADFGLSKMGFRQDEVADSYCGSPEYMAPEMLLQSGYNYTLDLYTLGVILYEFTTGLPPFYSEDQEVLFQNIAHGQVEYPTDIHPNLKKLLERMLKKDPNERICSMEEIKKSDWFSDVNWNMINQRGYKPAIVLDLYKTYIHEEFLHEDVSELGNNFLKAGQEEPLFEFFKFQKNSSRLVIYGKTERQVRIPTEISQIHPSRETKKKSTILTDKFNQTTIQTSSKAFLKNVKKTPSGVSGIQSNNVSGIYSGKQSNHTSTLPDHHPREIKKKITLVKRNQKQNSLSNSERNHSVTPKSNSLKKLTVVSGKNFNSKRQSDYGHDHASASREASDSKSKGKNLRQILSTKKIASSRDSNPLTDKKNIKSTYRIMLG